MASDALDLSEHVGETVPVHPRHLVPYHRNPRRGDIDAIKGSLLENGQYAPLTVNAGTLTGRRNEVLTGNHTLAAIRALAEAKPFDVQWHQVAVHVVDVDDDEAGRIVLVDNRSFDQGEGTDDALVYELLKDVGTAGTAYTDEQFDAFEDQFDKVLTGGDADPEPEKPSLTPPKEPSVIGFTITFDDEAQQETWFGFVRWLAAKYDDPDLTLAERLERHLTETESERV